MQHFLSYQKPFLCFIFIQLGDLRKAINYTVAALKVGKRELFSQFFKQHNSKLLLSMSYFIDHIF